MMEDCVYCVTVDEDRICMCIRSRHECKGKCKHYENAFDERGGRMKYELREEHSPKDYVFIVDTDDTGSIADAMLFKANHIKAKTSPDVFVAAANKLHFLESLENMINSQK